MPLAARGCNPRVVDDRQVRPALPLLPPTGGLAPAASSAPPHSAKGPQPEPAWLHCQWGLPCRGRQAAARPPPAVCRGVATAAPCAHRPIASLSLVQRCLPLTPPRHTPSRQGQPTMCPSVKRPANKPVRACQLPAGLAHASGAAAAWLPLCRRLCGCHFHQPARPALPCSDPIVSTCSQPQPCRKHPCHSLPDLPIAPKCPIPHAPLLCRPAHASCAAARQHQAGVTSLQAQGRGQDFAAVSAAWAACVGSCRCWCVAFCRHVCCRQLPVPAHCCCSRHPTPAPSL